MKHGKNNFDSIRLMAAVAVIFDHSHAIVKVAEPTLLGNSVGGIAVKIFFVVSGYLICTSWIIYSTDWTSGLDVAPYFLLGGLVRFMRWERYLDSMFALFLVACVALMHTHAPVTNEVLLYVLLPYAVLSLATSAQRLLQDFGRFGDLSYGVYIYAFLVQQSVAHLTDNRLSAIQNALVTLPIVLVLAWLSWHLVEKPMLSLKPVVRSTKISGRIDGAPSIEGCG